MLMGMSLLITTQQMLWANLPWNGGPYNHFAQSEDLRDLLKNFMATQGIHAVVNDDIDGTISGHFQNIDPQAFFDGMMTANALVWFYDGSNLYIDPVAYVQPKSLQIHYVSAEKLIQAIQDVGYQASKWSITKIPQAQIINITGPNKFVDKVTDLALALDIGLAEKDTIRVFPLKYAWAQDTSFAYQGSSITVPGVATQLQQLMFGQTGPSHNDTSSQPKIYPGSLSAPQRSAQSMTAMSPLGGLDYPNNPESDQQASSKQSRPSTMDNIQPNVQLNAIVVRDSAGRMPIYESAIAMLDRPVPIIEITVSIIDIDSQYSNELGNRLFSAEKTTGNTYKIGIAPSGGGSDGLSNTGFYNGFSTPANIGLSATVNAYKFVEAIRALENDSKAQTLARPSVLTLDNTEAVIDRQQTFYVPLNAQYSSSLYNVNAGTVLRVTPHLIEENNEFKVKLLVNIQDGAIDFANQVSALPTVSQSSVSTQAVVKEGQGLLVAGQYKKFDSRGNTGVPILSKIPLIGYLFATKIKTRGTAERMYLITPRIINESSDIAYTKVAEPMMANHCL